ncbi:MAG: endonuclease/exonuclease/phosphatase family protein [Planctomycetota bacterium]|nr:endonuclease/exonuclease/phosphatase family protein [Planctomycetota bacterium]
MRLLLLCAFVLVGCRSSSSSELRMVVYNIKHGRGMDGVVDLERTARVIEAGRPNVVVLQEVDHRCARSASVDQTAWLAERLGMVGVFGRFMDHDGGEYGMALLTSFDEFSAINHELPAGPEPRSSLALTLQTPRGPVTVVGIHFYRTEAERLAQAEATLAAVAELEGPVILAGDFNSQPDSPVMARVREVFTNVEKGADHLTFSSVEPSVEIDHVLVKPLSAWSTLTLDVLDEPLASDHRPLVFTARWAR